MSQDEPTVPGTPAIKLDNTKPIVAKPTKKPEKKPLTKVLTDLAGLAALITAIGTLTAQCKQTSTTDIIQQSLFNVLIQSSKEHTEQLYKLSNSLNDLRVDVSVLKEKIAVDGYSKYKLIRRKDTIPNTEYRMAFTPCKSDKDCNDTASCHVDGFCHAKIARPECLTDIECLNGYKCEAHTCVEVISSQPKSTITEFLDEGSPPQAIPNSYEEMKDFVQQTGKPWSHKKSD